VPDITAFASCVNRSPHKRQNPARLILLPGNVAHPAEISAVYSRYNAQFFAHASFDTQGIEMKAAKED
jgi:hypothetical protein